MKESNENLTANPGPLGLIGFGLTTVLLNLHNAGLFGLDAMILAMGIFLGGAVQVIVGIMEWKKNNMFGMIAFTSYGFFWLSLVALLIMPKMEVATSSTSTAMGYYLAIWGVFSLGMFIVTFKMPKTMSILFGSVCMLFFSLAISDFTGSASIKVISGVVGVFCGSTALYLAFAQLINHEFKRNVLPI